MNNLYKQILKQYWGYDDFRGIQREIIESITARKDTLGLMPTGGGKSITFQVPALAMEGTCLVISPLISLMRDQVQRLRQLGVKATAVYSGMSRGDIIAALENCILGGYKLLYVSPERLETDLFLHKLAHMKVSFITVDEAHCISQWGYDFRPSYLQIARIRAVVPQAPVLALTATATPFVVEDIQLQLNFADRNVIRMSFERKNLTYIARHAKDKKQEALRILRGIKGCAIIYTRNRLQTHEIAKLLTDEGISATCYHAGLAQVLRDDRQERWQKGEYRVMVATNAFGMGIDKADVRLVLHSELPDSPEAYFQEAGRAGRDGKPAYAVLIYDRSDCAKLLRRVKETYPDPDYVRDVYEHLCYYLQMAMGDGEGVTREFDLEEFCYRFKFFPVVAHNALLLLSNAGYIDFQEEDERVSRLRFILTRDSLYRLRDENPVREKVMHTLLRKYSGLFSGFALISETVIAHETGLTSDQVYHTLKALAMQRVVEYIPRKRTSYIKFTQPRLETREIVLPPNVYKDRREQYERRVKAMIEYVTDKGTCHSRFLLNYFGELTAKDCGRCDVCTAASDKEQEERAIRQSIRRQLERSPLFPDEVDLTGFHKDLFLQVAGSMLMEEEIFLDKEQRFTLRRP
ncbi:MAG: RecQ family ATP-dependent DNA helicase [Prevotellaceae bacterium]|nr:RecQ family ATP-dependent DNA helicase [Prevotellaceae bacterium]